MEGRFPCVSGLRFKYNSSLPEGQWINPADVIVKKWNDLEGTPIDLEKIYSVSSTEYITHGKDGYDEFLNMKITRDEHSSFDVTTMIYKTFKEL